MNTYIIFGLLIITLLIILILSLSLFFVIKKASYLSKKEKDFIIFAIDMYIDYAKKLDIQSEEQHEQIVKQLKNIKKNNLK